MILVGPHISQPYVVPPPNSNSVFANSINDTAVYSIWEHFLDFCVTDINSVVTVPRIVPPLDPYNTINIHTGKKRLPIFIQLSQNNDE